MFVKSVEHLVVQRTTSIPQQTTALSFTFKLNGSIKIMQRYTLIVEYASTSTSWKYTVYYIPLNQSRSDFRCAFLLDFFVSIVTQLSGIHENLVHEPFSPRIPGFYYWSGCAPILKIFWSDRLWCADHWPNYKVWSLYYSIYYCMYIGI